MSCQLHFFPRREIDEDFFHQRMVTIFETRDLRRQIEFFARRETLELLELFFDLNQRFFKLQPTGKHRFRGRVSGVGALSPLQTLI